MKMTAMKQPIPTTGRKLILPAPKAATKSVPSDTVSRPQNILPAPGFKAKTILPAKGALSKPSPRKEIKAIKPTSAKMKIPASRIKSVMPRLRVKRDVVSKRFVQFSIPKIRFQKLVRDIAVEYLPDCKFQVEALYALQVACEDFLAGFFYDANLCTLHAKRVTLMDKDTLLVKRLRGMELD